MIRAVFHQTFWDAYKRVNEKFARATLDALREMDKVTHNIIYRVFMKYCVFSLNDVIFLNSASFAAALVFYLQCRGLCTQQHWKTERGQSPRNIFQNFRKKHNI